MKEFAKPVYHFNGEVVFVADHGNTEHALVNVPTHPCGYSYVHTSTVLQKFSDGSFETRNSIYKPEGLTTVVEA